MLARALALVFALLKLCALAAIVGWFYLHPGQIHIVWEDYTIDTSMGFAVFVLFIIVSLVALLYHAWRRLVHLPRDWRASRINKAKELGYRALNKGLLAVVAGDTTQAVKQSRKALSFLPDTALTHLLAAQAAQLNNDDITADTHLAKLAQHPDGALFGLRGQLTRALQRQDSTEAVRLARLAYTQQPQQPWTIDTAVQMEARQQNWVQVEKILRAALRLGRDITAPHEARWQSDLAASLVALSDQLLGRDDVDGALDCAREALKRVPGWPPAAIRVAQLWQRKAYRQRALKTLRHAWEIAPHPDIVPVWLRIYGGERAQDSTAALEKLVAAHPDHVVSAMTMADAFAKAGLWGVARTHALRALDFRADRGVYRLLASIERGDNKDTDKSAAWLDKEAAALPEPQWQCTQTHVVYTAWQALNGQSQFNTIQWQTPNVNDATEQQKYLL